MALVLLVEDEQLLRWALQRRIEQAGHTVHGAATLAEAELHVREHRPEVVLLDIGLPDGNGLDFFARERERLTESVVIVLTASGRVEDAVRAMKLGALDFLPKPVNQDELMAILDRAVQRQREGLDAEGWRRAREGLLKGRVIAESPAMKEVLALAAAVASSPTTTVLIHGETGSGKEVVARYIHFRSPRGSGPLVAFNCAALPEQLVESELFGHERGAFTDAKSSRKGLFELAHGGTVVLDEIGELPPPIQVKLLRFLEEHSLRRIGGSREIFLDVRLLALTNRNLGEEVEEGRFRRDLLFRLDVFPLTVPPLRDRREDIIPLAHHFLDGLGAAVGKSFIGFAPAARQRLLRHSWPGNVRELRNLMERVAILEPGGLVSEAHLPLDEASPPVATAGIANDLIIPLDEVELMMVSRAMHACRGNQSAAARLLGVSRDQIRYRIQKYREEGKWAAGRETPPAADLD